MYKRQLNGLGNQEKQLRIGVNALYLIPGGVGGTEIYLRNLLAALAAIDSRNHYVLYVNRETGAGLCPDAPNFSVSVQPVRARRCALTGFSGSSS